MKTIVVYASRFGNTRRIANAIAAELGKDAEVQLLSVEEAPQALPPDIDLLVIGGPTEGHRMTEPMAAFLDGLRADTVRGVPVATFDTRLRWPRWLSGSAGRDIHKKLECMGATMLAEPESFFVYERRMEQRKMCLEDGELGRAAAWADVMRGLLSATAAHA